MKQIILFPLRNTIKEGDEITWRDAKDLSDSELDFEMSVLYRDAAARNFTPRIYANEVAVG